MFTVIERSGQIYVIPKTSQESIYESYTTLWATASQEPINTDEFKTALKSSRQYVNQSLFECQYVSEDEIESQDNDFSSLAPKKLYSTW
jgi:hypothetical protein